MNIETIYIILASIFLSQEATRYKLTNRKPLNCEVCLSFWLTLIVQSFVQNYHFLYLIIVGLATSQLTRVVNVLLIRLYGNLIK